MSNTGDPSLSALVASVDAFRSRNTSDKQLLEDLLKLLRRAVGREPVKVGRRGLWGFGKIESVAVTVGGNRYQASLASRNLVCTKAPASGGIGIGGQTEVPWSEWINQLSRALSSR